MSRTRNTIVIIDDDASVRRALGRLIRSVRLTVEAFATAEEFLQSTKQPMPACLILDIHLPGLSGLELQKRLTEEGPRVPVIFITAYGGEQMRELALREGAIAFLQKPFGEEALLDAIGRAVSL